MLFAAWKLRRVNIHIIVTGEQGECQRGVDRRRATDGVGGIKETQAQEERGNHRAIDPGCAFMDMSPGDIGNIFDQHAIIDRGGIGIERQHPLPCRRRRDGGHFIRPL